MLEGWQQLLTHPDLVDERGSPRDPGSAAAIAHLRMDAAETLHELGRIDEEIEQLEAGFLLSRTFSNDMTAIIAIGLSMNEAELLLERGEVDSALQMFSRAVDFIDRGDPVACTASLSLARSAVVAREAGDDLRATPALSRLAERFGTPAQLDALGTRQLHDWPRDSARLAARSWEEILSGTARSDRRGPG